MFDRLSATACLAGTIPLAVLDIWILGAWVALLSIWLVWDHVTHRCSAATLADADIKRLAHALKEELDELNKGDNHA